MRAPLMHGLLAAIPALLVVAAGFGGEEAEKAATLIEHAKPLPAPEPGRLGTRGYEPSKAEAPFFERLAAAERVTGGFFSDYGITGKTGIRVGWFGIVRKIVEDKDRNRTDLLVEMKYFDGLTDLHLQLVSFSGAGDVRARLTGTGLGILHLSLVKIYGTVESETDSVPTLAAEFVRHWDWGQFSFMNYGKPKGNQEWRKLSEVPVDRIYSPTPNDRFYELRLGKRKHETEAEGPAKAPATTKDLARSVFSALKANDLGIAASALATVADIEWSLKHFEKAEKVPGETRRRLEEQGGADAVVAKSRKKFADDFKTARTALPSWNEAQFVGLVDEESEVSDHEGMEVGNCVFAFSVGGTVYRIRLLGCGHVGRGWIVSEGMKLVE